MSINREFLLDAGAFGNAEGDLVFVSESNGRRIRVQITNEPELLIRVSPQHVTACELLDVLNRLGVKEQRCQASTLKW